MIKYNGKVYTLIQFNTLVLNPDFDVDKLEQNEYKQSYDSIIAKTPRIKGRIFLRKDKDRSGTYVELLADRYYDKEKRQMRNKRVCIGTCLGSPDIGLMFVNRDNYYNYFDTNGNLVHDPLRRRREKEEKEKAEAARQKAEEEKRKAAEANAAKEAAADHRDGKAIREETPETNKEEIKKERNVDEIRADLLEQEKRMQEKEKLLDEKLKQAKADLEQIEEYRKKLEDAIEVRKVELQEKYDSHIELLEKFLDSYIVTVKEQAKRRPNMLMRQTQIRTINEVLEVFRDFFAGSESEDFFHLAEEPREDDLEHHPGTTYGEMDILLAAYKWTIDTYRTKCLYMKEDVK